MTFVRFVKKLLLFFHIVLGLELSLAYGCEDVSGLLTNGIRNKGLIENSQESKVDLPLCQPGTLYRFEAEFYREDLSSGDIYPEITVWGKRIILDTHRMAGRFQLLHARIRCPDEVPEGKSKLLFRNTHPGTVFQMRNPRLVQIEEELPESHSLPDETFYPIGVYGATPVNIGQIKNDGLSTVVIPMTGDGIRTCLQAGMHCTLSVPRDPERLQDMLYEFAPLLAEGAFSFYVNDEPGIHSFPREKAEELQRIIKDRFPSSFTNMAIVRPQVIPEYRKSADYFMLDQYPVPKRPMIWLSDSMDEAAGYVGRDRLQSVIQAFGGEKYAASGWPRLPTFHEMDCLAFLSVIHGSRGIYFYSYPEITATEQGRNDFKRVVSRLNSLRSWLEQKNLERDIAVKMVSRFTTDENGHPAVHCAAKEQHSTRMLLCVNVLRTPVEAEVGFPAGSGEEWTDYFTGDLYASEDDALFVRFGQLEVKVLMEQR